jgi:hypothetical protein
MFMVKAAKICLATIVTFSAVSAYAQGAICGFSGPPRLLPRTSTGDLDFKTLGSPKYIRVVGCGGGGGGSGAGRATNTGYGSSGAGGAGAQITNYLFGPIDNTTALQVSLSGDGAGGCGGATDHARCVAVPTAGIAPDEGQTGHDGVTVKIGNMMFEGGQGGRATNASGVARGGQLTSRGGNGGVANISDPTPGVDTGTYRGGKIGARPTDGRGFGGIPGAGGGASRVGNGGQGGSAGSGDGKSTGAMNNAGDAYFGEICAGGGGGGGAAGGMFPGGNGGNGGEGWIIIYSFITLAGENPPTEPFPGDLSQFGQPCALPQPKPPQK